MQANEIVTDIVKELSGKDTVHETDTLQQDLGLDSLGLVALLIELEQMMDIELNESDMNPFNLSTVADAIRLAENYEDRSHEKEC